MANIISVREAADLIHDGMTVGISGFGAFASPDSILEAIGDKFRRENTPRDLTIVSGVAPGDFVEDGCGLSKIRDEGIIKTLIASHLRMSPAIGRACSENKIAAFSMPLGVYGQLMAAIGGKRPGILTHVGLHTYADPRQDGCIMNEAAREQGREIVQLVNIDGRDYLFYKAFPIDACILHASYADELGNVSLQDEPVHGDLLELASAVHNNGGIVIVEVKEIVGANTLDSTDLKVSLASADVSKAIANENLTNTAALVGAAYGTEKRDALVDMGDYAVITTTETDYDVVKDYTITVDNLMYAYNPMKKFTTSQSDEEIKIAIAKYFLTGRADTVSTTIPAYAAFKGVTMDKYNNLSNRQRYSKSAIQNLQRYLKRWLEQNNTTIEEASDDTLKVWYTTLTAEYRMNAASNKAYAVYLDTFPEYARTTDQAEFMRRLESGENLPLMTSCCPAWVKHVENDRPQFLKNLSSALSPMQMFATVLKDRYLEKDKEDGRETYHIAIMPCTAKKMEAARPEFRRFGKPNVDLVLTTQEVIKMIKESGIRFAALEKESPDLPFGMGSGAGEIFGTAGGVAEAVIRHCLPDKSKNALRMISNSGLRGREQTRFATIPIGDREVRVAVVHGLAAADKLLDQIERGEVQLDLVEVMTCRTGCVGGAGQPTALMGSKRKRADGLYELDRSALFKRAERNPVLNIMYAEDLNDRAHELLHHKYEGAADSDNK